MANPTRAKKAKALRSRRRKKVQVREDADLAGIYESMYDKPRDCDGCTACCTVMEVEELGKPHGVKCGHECAEGCAIYEDRPDGCRNYVCLYASGAFGEDAKPSDVGFMVDICYHGVIGGSCFTAREYKPDGLRSKLAKAVLGELAKTQLVLLISEDERRFIGPVRLLQAVEVKMREAVQSSASKEA